MPRYPEEIIEEVRSSSDIVAVIGERVKLTRRGANYFGLCPFHREKTPSFCVSPGKQMYYCFGCGAGGNVITFLMAYENDSFSEALEQLAARAGIALPKREMTEDDRRREGVRDRLLAMNTEAAKFYYYLLRGSAGAEGMAYFKRRGLSAETMRRFGLGFAPNMRDPLYLYLRGKDYSDEELNAGGLVRIGEKGARDRFWNRVIFPIMDRSSRVIGFGGRVMGEGEPKYLNSPETPIFDKSRNLYGLNLARSTRRPYFLLCEGYMDVIALHQAGFDCAVASLGTSLTAGHALLLKRHTKEVILTYDSDEAGVKAAMRAIPILRDAGLGVRVLNMRPYKDPDEFLTHESADAYEQRISEALNFFLYETDVWKAGYDLQDPAQQTAFHKKLAEELTGFEDGLERENYLNAVSQRHAVPKELLRGMMNRVGNRRMTREAPDGGAENPEENTRLRGRTGKDEGLLAAQQYLLTWAAGKNASPELIRSLLREEDFDLDLYRDLFREILSIKERGGSVSPASVLNRYLDDEEKSKLAAAAFSKELPESAEKEDVARVLTENLRRLRRANANRALRESQDGDTIQRLIKERSEASRLTIAPEDV